MAIAEAHLTQGMDDPSYTSHVDTFARDNMPPPEQLPEFLFTRPEFQYPPRINCMVPFLDRWVEEGHGDAPCMFGLTDSYTYRELQALVNRICNVLVDKLGLVPGGRVMLRSANNPMMVATYLAVIKAGGVCVATMPLLRAKELTYPIQKAKIPLALCDSKLVDEMEKAKLAAPELRRIVYWGVDAPDSLEAMIADASPEFTAIDTAADDICLIAFTSGTTGDPKGTMHFHRDMLAVCDGFAHNVLRASKDDRFIGSAPLAFTFGFGGVLFPLHIGASFVRRPGRKSCRQRSRSSRSRCASPRQPRTARCSPRWARTTSPRCVNAFRPARRCQRAPTTLG
jgi:2-aminobenzoate-CoA ligase